MAAIKGRAVVWSVGAITYTAGIVIGTGDAFTQSLAVTRTSEKAEVKDNQGVIRAQIFSAFKKMLTITVVPAGGTGGANTIAIARASADLCLLQAGTLIEVADDSGTTIDAKYNLISARENRTIDGAATIDLELEAGDEGVDITNLVA
jgi:hypothetical protein